MAGARQSGRSIVEIGKLEPMADDIPPIDEPEPAGREPGEDDLTIEEIRARRDEREHPRVRSDYLEGLPLEVLRARVVELESDLIFAVQHGAEKNFISELADDTNVARAKLARRDAAKKEEEARRGNGAEPGKQADFWPEVLSAKQLLEMPSDPTRWVWDNCLPVRATSVLVAKPYVGKSTFAACLALAVARGADFLGRPTQKGAALYVYLDGPLDELKENLIKLGMTEYDRIFVYGGRRPERQIDWVAEKVQKYNVKLLIVDTMQKFFGFQKSGGDAYEERINKTQPLLDLVNENNFHAVFTVHAAKNSADNMISALGTVGTEANARASLYLRKLQGTNQRTFQTEQNAGKNFLEIGLSDPKEGFIERIGTRQEVEIELAKPLIVQFLDEAELGQTQKEIKAAIQKAPQIIGRAINAMLKLGELERTGAGKAGSPFRYFRAGRLVEKPPVKELETTSLFR